MKNHTASQRKRHGNAKAPNKLRRPQLRALAVLAEAEATSADKSFTLTEMSGRAKVSESMLKQGMGAVDPTKRQQDKEIYGYESLLTRGLVIVTEIAGETRYYLSPLGKTKTDSINQELKAVQNIKPNDAGVESRTGPKAPKNHSKLKAINPRESSEGKDQTEFTPTPTESVEQPPEEKGRRYPWEKWFEMAERDQHSVIMIHQGIDYNGLDHSFTAYARRAAKRFGYLIAVTTGKGFVVIKVTGRTAPDLSVHNNFYRKARKVN